MSHSFLLFILFVLFVFFLCYICLRLYLCLFACYFSVYPCLQMHPHYCYFCSYFIRKPSTIFLTSMPLFLSVSFICVAPFFPLLLFLSVRQTNTGPSSSTHTCGASTPGVPSARDGNTNPVHAGPADPVTDWWGCE